MTLKKKTKAIAAKIQSPLYREDYYEAVDYGEKDFSVIGYMRQVLYTVEKLESLFDKDFENDKDLKKQVDELNIMFTMLIGLKNDMLKNWPNLKMS